MLPNNVNLSTKATNKAQYIKTQTGLTPNILYRIAIMLAVKEGGNLKNAGVGDYDGQKLNKSVLFGDHYEVYDVVINQYLHEFDINIDLSKAVTAMIEVGIHKMGQVKNLVDICNLK